MKNTQNNDNTKQTHAKNLNLLFNISLISSSFDSSTVPTVYLLSSVLCHSLFISHRHKV